MIDQYSCAFHCYFTRVDLRKIPISEMALFGGAVDFFVFLRRLQVLSLAGGAVGIKALAISSVQLL